MKTIEQTIESSKEVFELIKAHPAYQYIERPLPEHNDAMHNFIRRDAYLNFRTPFCSFSIDVLSDPNWQEDKLIQINEDDYCKLYITVKIRVNNAYFSCDVEFLEIAKLIIDLATQIQHKLCGPFLYLVRTKELRQKEKEADDYRLNHKKLLLLESQITKDNKVKLNTPITIQNTDVSPGNYRLEISKSYFFEVIVSKQTITVTKRKNNENKN